MRRYPVRSKSRTADHEIGHGRHHMTGVSYNRSFLFGVALNVIFVAAEVVVGVVADSVVLLADAGHNLSDVLGLMLAWGAGYLQTWKPTYRRTYGFKSSTILAALANAVILLVAVGGISWESLRRLISTTPNVSGYLIMTVAGAGVLINTVTAVLFMAGRETDLNIRGAFLHMAADAGVSAGVVIAGFGIVLTGRLWIDPAVSLIIAMIILFSMWGQLKESVNLVLHAVPAGIDAQRVQESLEQLKGVTAVHDLHIWAMSTTDTALTAHLVTPDRKNDDLLIARAGKFLHDEFGIVHVTLQIEHGPVPIDCTGASCGPRLE